MHTPISLLAFGATILFGFALSTSLVGLITRHGQAIAKPTSMLKNLVITVVVVNRSLNDTIHVLVFLDENLKDAIVVVLVIDQRGIGNGSFDALDINIMPPLNRKVGRLVMRRRAIVARFPVVNMDDAAALFDAPVLVIDSPRVVVADDKVTRAAILGQVSSHALILDLGGELVGRLSVLVPAGQIETFKALVELANLLLRWLLGANLTVARSALEGLTIAIRVAHLAVAILADKSRPIGLQ